MTLLGVTGLTGMAALAVGMAQPAQAAISCSALPVTGFPAGPIQNGSPCGTVQASDQLFTVDFSDSSLFTSPSGAFNIDKFISLQAASIKTATGGGSISFEDVEFLVSGTTNAGQLGTQSFTDTSIAVWQATPGSGSQGFTGYSVSDPFNTSPPVGTGTNYRKASFTLAPVSPANPQTGLDAGQINTLAFQPSAFGINTITNLKIRGVIKGSSVQGAAAAFGLASFASDPAVTLAAPTAIYGRAVDINPVPGPLPIFGAGAAFGMSRKLRRRIGASKTVA